MASTIRGLLSGRKAVAVAFAGAAALLAPASGLAGTPQIQPRAGEPLSGLSASELNRFEVGKVDFGRVFEASEGLGPIFNQFSCAGCHNTPVGGSGSITVTRFGLVDPKSGEFDPLAAMGGSLLQAESISLECEETIPAGPDVITAIRATPSTMGFGLIEAIPDADLIDLEDNPPSANVTGRVHMVPVAEAPGPLRAGRFGWKAQVATVMTFSGDASLNEMGITNDLFGTENAPNGDAMLLADCDTVADPEDVPDGMGVRFIDRITDFQRFLAAPPQTPKSGMTGEAIFTTIGCTDCHIPNFVTSNDISLEPAIRNKVIHPYADFLLHDMGQGPLFDGIVQGDAEAGEIRTPPLWGLRLRDPMLHNASVTGGTFADRVTQAIIAHGQPGSEAKPAVDAFIALNPSQKSAVVAFLDSLGRAEFDHDGNNVINDSDFIDFSACFALNGPFTPDDSCAISDFDQDGDVDCIDYEAFRVAWNGPPANPPDIEGCAVVGPAEPVPAISGFGRVALLALVGLAVVGLTIRRRQLA